LNSVNAQNLEGVSAESLKKKANDKIKDALKDPFKVSGGINASMTTYNAYGMEGNRDPLLWQIGMNVNFKILGKINVPFSANISSQQFALSLPNVPDLPQPFNTFGMSPKYKAFTVHVGYRSINLSELTLNGSQFLGGGVEIAPKGSFIKGKAIYGRFAKPILFNLDGSIAVVPTYARFGWGGGVTLGRQIDNQVTFNIFKARDDINSLNTNIDELIVRPADNLVFGTVIKQKITKKISIDGELDFSLYTSDIGIDEEVLAGTSYINNILIFKNNTSTSIKKAMIFNADYKPNFAKFKLKYRRIDADYKTLGTSYINDDYEDLSLKTSFALLKKKMMFSVQGGVRRDNLEEDKVSKQLRLISGVDVTYNVNEKWTIASNYSNFNSKTRQVIVLTIDSLYFSQTTQAFGLNVTRTNKGEKMTQTLNMAFNFQDAIVNETSVSSFYNANISWMGQLLKSKTTITTSLVAFHNISETNEITNIGPTVSLASGFFKKKMTLNLSVAYLPTFVDLVSAGSIINISAGGVFKINEKHKFNYNVSNIVRKIPSTPQSTELTATIAYQFTF